MADAPGTLAARSISDPVEAIVADGLTRAGILFIHDSEGAEVNCGLDFYLPTAEVHVECKRFRSERTEGQMARVKDIIVIQGVGAAKAFAALVCMEAGNV